MKIRRLKGRDRVRALFVSGEVIYKGPFLMRFIASEEKGDICFGVSVPKKKIALAVDRNRIKRQLWAIIRTNKPLLLKELNAKNTVIMIVYLNTSLMSSKELELHFVALIKQWLSSKNS